MLPVVCVVESLVSTGLNRNAAEQRSGTVRSKTDTQVTHTLNNDDREGMMQSERETHNTHTHDRGREEKRRGEN